VVDATILRVSGLRRYFDVSPPLLNRLIEGTGRRIVRAVDGVDFEVARGETFSLVGESGCGKSTIARLIVGLHAPTDGSIQFEGAELAAPGARRRHADKQARMQMIFQDPYASLNPRWRVAEIVAEPIRFRGLLPEAEIAARVGELLRQVGLSPRDAEKYPHEFSGGQRQRVSIARALAGQPEFLVCDEPTSALDVSVQAQILNLMRDLQRRLGLTYLFISHNLAVVYFVSTKVGVMYLGRLVEWGDTASIFAAPKHPYTRMLLDAIPDLAMSGRPRTPVAGEVPSPLDPPPGCTFHPRCPLATDRCKREVPRALPAGGTTVACHAVEEGRIPAWQSGFTLPVRA
jgi:peptide/nickel transport system ATP-binding protein